jgi:hypothetical protein
MTINSDFERDLSSLLQFATYYARLSMRGSASEIMEAERQYMQVRVAFMKKYNKDSR